MPNGTTLPGPGRSGPTIREVSAGGRLGGDYLCARYLDGDLRCARLRATDESFELEPLRCFVDADGPIGGECMAEGETVHCDIFDDPRARGRRPPRTYTFGFVPEQLEPLPRERIRGADGRKRLGPPRLCARGASGEVVCRNLDEQGKTWTLFEDSVELRGNGQELLSRRSDGTIECVGAKICAMMALADVRSSGAGPARRLDHVAAAWPNTLDDPPPVRTASRVPVPAARRILSVNPSCIETEAGATICWSYHEGPHTVGSGRRTDDTAAWGPHWCERVGDEISCSSDEADPTSPAPETFRVEGAERMLAVDGRLCVFTRQRTVTCRSAAGSRWGAHEQTLSLER